MQASGFRDAYEAVEKLDAVVLGISPDGAETLRGFRQKCSLPFQLGADVDHAVARLYQARRRFNLGTSRISYVVDKEGVIRGAFHSELSMSSHIDNTLRTLEALD